MRKLLLALAVTFSVSLAACGDDAPAGESQFSADAVVIDVRTPEEYTEGHLEGAKNIDFLSPDFAAQVDQLPKDAEYVLYCRSGNRSGQAKSIMENLGFTDVTNAGAYDDLK
ncbi:MAG: rhodanese-like domain-containing protein [Propionibacteriaceae bacterium]|nr:rhodanese-like domain-containing protein [Propionibacteriaceae bacterium]